MAARSGTSRQRGSVPAGTPFTLKEYYADPTSRPWKTTPPEWYATTLTYGSNAANEVLQNHSTNTYYPAGSLSKTITTDPDNKLTITFTDKKGRIVMSWKTDVSSSNHARTYTLYDSKDRVSKVLPPGVGINDANLQFSYLYDGADNVISKKMPDAAAVTMRYNTRDQLVLEQDGNLLAQNKWRCTQFDDYGRIVASGLYTGAVSSPVALGLVPTEKFTEMVYGTAGIEIGKVKTGKSRILDGGNNWQQVTNAYDAYGRIQSATGNNHLMVSDLAAEQLSFVYDFADNVLLETRTTKKTASSSYTIAEKHNYDHWGRNTLNTHKIGSGTEINVSQLNYNWKNELIEKNIGKTPVATNYLQSLDYSYNAQGWMTAMNSPSLGGTNTGFAACPTVSAMPNPGTASATPDMNDLFYFELKYDALQSGLSGTISKNGNISQVIWRVRGRERQSYAITYDYLDRMLSATYRNLNDAGTAVNNTNAWNESLSYDARGNILSLARNGKYKTTPTASCWTDGQTDNLAYTYYPGYNRLQKIADNAPAASKAEGWNNPANESSAAVYGYDASGNMNADPYKGMNITYNHLNLPTLITFAGGTKKIELLYSGNGTKLRKTVTDNNVLQYRQDYNGGLEYRSTGAVSLSLESMAHAEGRVYNSNVGTTSADALRYEYAIRDHLGNTRLMFTDKNNNGLVEVSSGSGNELLQETHYYPFGMEMNGPWSNDAAALDNPYKYNGKELNADFSLGWYDYGARWYDAAVGRWWSVDPLTDSFPMLNAYNYAKLNPIIFIDLKGDSAWPVIRSWSGKDVGGFSAFADQEIDRMQSNNEEFDCADLATTLLIRYASSEGLEVSFTTVEGKTISSSDDKFNNVSEFEGAVKTQTNAKSIDKDMGVIFGAPAPGDMTNNGFHVNIVTNPDPNTSYDSNGGIVPSASGSLPSRSPKDSTVPLTSEFKRWNVVKEAYRARHEEEN